MNLDISSDDFSDINNLIHSGECVAFVGAGITNPPGMGWQEIVDTIAKRCEVHIDDELSLPEVIDICIEKNPTRCNEVMRESFPLHAITSRTALLHIHRLPFKAMITTNFDPYIKLHSSGAHYNHTYVYPYLPAHLGIRNNIYYIHGFFNSEDPKSDIRTLVFGERSFKEAYQHSLLPCFLYNLLIFENILFVSFNPTEHYFSKLLRDSIRIQRSIITSQYGSTAKIPKRYKLIARPRELSEEIQVKLDQHVDEITSLEINPIFYDKRDEKYSGLEELLSRFIGAGEAKNQPAPFQTAFNTEEPSETEG